ncbi:MAG: hypothetical protein KatS3mg104_0530 [Phycisphaerae bacterium]|nr:MAG: hypothetical protein KatS3mg104_0530 [Phycisphaerae bacterium]
MKARMIFSRCLVLMALMSGNAFADESVSAPIQNPGTGHHGHKVGFVPVTAELDTPVTWSSRLDFFTNYGTYMPRLHCMVRADGRPDWPWIIVYVVLNIGVLTGYLMIFRFWCKSYYSEAPIDRNPALMNLALIFLLCATTGYLLSIIMFWWPAYRLQALFLAVLAVVTWAFASKAGGLRASFSAFRLERELQESLRQRAVELERLVAERTAEAEKAKQEAIQANEAKSRFVAHVSHEIRTPLTAMLGYTTLLGEKKDLDDSTRYEYINTVRNAGEHLLGIINDILDLSKVEAGKLDLNITPCDIRSIAGQVVRLFEARASEKGLKLELTVEPDVPQALMFDAIRVRQILSNLVSNAIKYTEQGRVDMVVKYEFNQLILQVRDTGSGISEDRCKDLFKPFVQLDQSMSRRQGGTGLGLVICRRFAERMGGTVTVQSKVGRGSTFTVSIPAPLAEGAIPVEDSNEQGLKSNVLSGKTILVAEDHPRLRQLTTFCIEKAGATVITATNGDQVLLEASKTNVDLILMDMQMPIRDGYSTARILRERGYTGPIVAFTAHAFASEKNACLEAGCSHCLTKPFDPARLAPTLAEYIRSMEHVASSFANKGIIVAEGGGI